MLKNEEKEVDKKIKSIMAEVEQGIITPTTKDHLEELEKAKRDVEHRMTREEIKSRSSRKRA